MEWINKYIFGAGVPVLLFLCAIFFLIRLSGKPLTSPVKMLKPLFRKSDSDGVSPIKAVLLALAGTLGVGNIIGVASAIAVGGAGAVFWMWVSAVFAMILKYAEVVLAVSHRRTRSGENFGGAMYYMQDSFALRNKKRAGGIFAGIFALLCIINAYCMGALIQSNAITQAFDGVYSFNSIFIGGAVAGVTAIVFFGKASKIFSLTEKLVPAVSLLYFAMSLVVIIKNAEMLPEIIKEIFTSAFTLDSAVGGIFGFFLSKALRYGTIRGLFSNEAGCGTAPIAHAASNTNSPVEQGFLGVIEVFVDTIVLCSMTAFVVLLNKESIFEYSDNPIMIVFSAFSNSLGSVSNPLLCISVLLFAFSTIVCWGYYGRECVYYLSRNKILQKIYLAFYVVFVFVGALISPDSFWGIADFTIGAMTAMNLFVLLKMNREVKDITDKYFNKKLPK